MNRDVTCKILVLGKVQGIGLRKKIKTKAEELSLTGSATNLPPPISGVEIILQGHFTGIANQSAWLKEKKGVTRVENNRIFGHPVLKKFEIK